MNTEVQHGNKPPVQPETEDDWLTCPDCGSQVRGRSNYPSMDDVTIMACTSPLCWWEYAWRSEGDPDRIVRRTYVGHIRPWVRRGEGR